MTVTVFGCIVLITVAEILMILLPNWKIYQALKTMNDHISKHLQVEFQQKYYAHMEYNFQLSSRSVFVSNKHNDCL